MSDGVTHLRNKRYREYLKSEMEAATVYSALAEIEKDSARAAVFRRLADAEIRHAARWVEKLGMDQAVLDNSIVSFKVKFIKWTARLIGTRRMVPLLLKGEAKELKIYATDVEARDIALEERQHARTLRSLAGEGISESWSPKGVIGSGGSLRAAVLGVNDGLISNLSLVMGVAGGADNAGIVLLAGVAGLLAGAFSMAAGEYVSMRSQREIFENEIRKERIELEEWPDEEKRELELIYQAKGLGPGEARQVARGLMANPEVVLDTMVREELGLDPSSLGSPWKASFSSFLAFAVGAVFPILPYVFQLDSLTLLFSAVLSGSALVVVGGLLALVSGRNMMWGAMRMLFAGGAAAVVTFLVGRFIGGVVVG